MLDRSKPIIITRQKKLPIQNRLDRSKPIKDRSGTANVHFHPIIVSGHFDPFDQNQNRFNF